MYINIYIYIYIYICRVKPRGFGVGSAQEGWACCSGGGARREHSKCYEAPPDLADDAEAPPDLADDAFAYAGPLSLG